MHRFLARAVMLVAAAGSGCASSTSRGAAPPDRSGEPARAAALPALYTTKTPYEPAQDPASYEPPPDGFRPIFTELVARHGARGLSGFKDDGALYAMWQAAEREGALTALGAQLGPDLRAVIRANALLGAGVAGIAHPGYGNLTQLGRAELTELAARLVARLPELFASLPARGRAIVVASSGIDRAVDSAGFFTGALASQVPAVAPLIAPAPALTRYPSGAPVAQPAGVNRFLLYFHKLAAATDLVTDPADPYHAVYQDSLAYQASAEDPGLASVLAALTASAAVDAAARGVLLALFSEPFVDRLAARGARYANTGSFTVTSDDGSATATVTGDGKTVIDSPAAAVASLYAVYAVGPAMRGELAVDLTRYLPDDAAALWAYLDDAETFYRTGPGIAETAPVNFQLAEGLVDDLFAEVDAVARGELAHGAVLRFSHAEIIIPLVARLGLAIGGQPVPRAQTFRYDTSPWRGARVSPFAANLQWDVFRDPGGALVVRMLHDEAEVDFPPACDAARYAPASRYYRYDRLAACARRAPRAVTRATSQSPARRARSAW